MAVTKTLEDIISEQASIVCEQIEAASAFAESEEDLRIEVEKAIEVFRKEADLPELKGHHEVTIGKGRADSVYDYVFIEYKKPGRLKESNDAPGNREVIKQLQDRAKDFKSELKRDPQELFGVGTDGNYFITGRYRNGKWEISPARERSVYVVEDFLRKLSSLGVAGKPFLPEYLAGDFGAESDRKLARAGIAILYERIREVEKKADDYPKAKVLFEQWRILFGEVCGYDIKAPSSKIKQLGEFYGVKKDPNPAALLFAVHSYYALFMKFLAAEIATMFNPLSVSFLARLHQTGSSEKLREELRDLEDGGIYRQLGIKNFLEGDLFSWYLDAWDSKSEKIIRDMVACLDEYDPKTLSVDPIESRDLLKKLYQQLFPKTVRHDLGEYYTPDWLAELVFERVGYDGNPDKRVLDPACGSGTFLVMAINKLREYADKHMIPKHELLSKILNNIIGFDLNPLAVMAARTNYLMALREMLKLGGEIEIPVYLCDSIMTPAEYGELITKEGTVTGGVGKVQELKTSAARFMIPTEIAQSRQIVAAYAEELEHCVRNDYTEDEFVRRLKGEKIPVDTEELHKTLYRQISKLKKQNQNDIWARIIKNSFAPLFTERVDYVIGNPPWINWRNLPDDYRRDVAHLWSKYHLFEHSGLAARLGGAMDDLSVLMTYTALDRYLKSGGYLGFVITQTVFKTEGGGSGFRRFRLQDETALKVVEVDDLSNLQPFEGATNRTSIVTLLKGEKTIFPVSYKVWKRRVGAPTVASEDSLSQVLAKTNREDQVAVLIDSNNETSQWITAPSESLTALKKVLGHSSYRARIGAHTGGANGINWVKVEKKGRREWIISNLADVGRKKFKQITKSVESEFVYPLLRGRDIEKWRAQPSGNILAPYSTEFPTKACPESELKRRFPKTYEFLKSFEKELKGRSHYSHHFKPGEDPFYSIYNVGEYTFAPYKLVWREQTTLFAAAVVGVHDEKRIVADHKAMIIPFNSAKEAYFCCACLNNAIARLVIASYTVSTQINTHVLRYVAVPRFQSSIHVHNQLVELSEKAHHIKADGKDKDLANVESEIDNAAAELWGITSSELAQIHKALTDR